MRKTLAILGLLSLAICAAGQTANRTAQQAPTTLMGPPEGPRAASIAEPAANVCGAGASGDALPAAQARSSL
jgi:hypothetical protein